MSLRTHGQQFLELVDHVDSFSRGDRKVTYDVGPEEAETISDGETQL
jgi:hypothetical protein